MRHSRYFVMLTYTCSNLPAWAQLSSDGVLTLASSAPAGAVVLNLAASDGTTTWTRSVTVQVGAGPAATQWFSVSSTSPRRIMFKLSVESGPTKLQRPRVKFILKTQGPALPPPDGKSRIAISLSTLSA